MTAAGSATWTPTPLAIALTFDADSDRFDASLAADGEDPRSNLGWRGVAEGIPRLADLLADFRDDAGRAARATWFVRADAQLAAEYGDAAHLLHAYAERWRRFQERGDEIGWHPHLYRIVDGRWRQETEPERLAEQLAAGLEAVRRTGIRPTASRIGEAFGANAIMVALDELGIAVDSTALPGRVRRDPERALDWAPTPEVPYHPSRTDYRRPGADSLSLLEVPFSMIETRAEYDAEPLRRYLDLSFHHHAIREGLAAHLPSCRLLVAVAHPSALLPELAPGRHGLLSFDLAELRRNLEFILDECHRHQREVRFTTLAEVSMRIPAERAS